MTGELDEVGLGEELAEEPAVRSLEPALAGGREQELLGRHLGRPQPESLLEVNADDVGERGIVLLEGADGDEVPSPEVGQRVGRDLVWRPRRRRRARAPGAVQQPVENCDDREQERDPAPQEVVGTPVDGHRLRGLDVADVGRVRRLREQALDRHGDLLRWRLRLLLARHPVLDGRRLEDAIARAVADQAIPAREDRLPLAPGRRLDPEVDDVEVAEPLRRLLDEHLRVGRGDHLDDVAEARPDRHPVRLGVRTDLDRRRRLVGSGMPDDAEEQREEDDPHCRRSRIRKKRSSASV